MRTAVHRLALRLRRPRREPTLGDREPRTCANVFAAVGWKEDRNNPCNVQREHVCRSIIPWHDSSPHFIIVPRWQVTVGVWYVKITFESCALAARTTLREAPRLNA